MTIKFNKVDFLLIFFSGLIMIGSVYLAFDESILFQSGPKDRSNRESLGKVSLSYNQVKRKYDRDINWYLLAIQDDIFENDTVFTEENANAEITFNDGSKLLIDPSTMLVINRKNNKSTIDIKVGSISSKLAKGEGLSITSQGKTQEVRGDQSQIQFNVSSTGKSALTVLDGDVVIKSGSQEQKLSQNQTAQINTEGEIGHVKKIVVNLKTPTNNSILWQKGEKEAVNFSWEIEESNSETQSFVIEVASDINFKKIIFNKTSSAFRTSLKDLPLNQQLYWRVTQIINGEEYPSATFRLRIEKASPPKLIFPKNKSLVQFKPQGLMTEENIKKGTEINFGWNDLYQAPFYEIYLSLTDDFNRIIFQQKVAGLSIRTPKLPPHVYYWKVRPFYNENDHGDWSEIFTFKMAPEISRQELQDLISQKKFEAPTTSKEMIPEQGTYDKNSPDSIKNAPKVLHLNWSVIKDAEKYRVQISNSDQFTKETTLEKTTFENFYPVKIKTPGKYFWRVAAVNRQNLNGDFSASDFFIINLEKKLNMPIINTQAQDEERFLEIGDYFTIDWNKVPFAEEYHLEVAFDDQFSDIISRKKTDNHQFNLKITRPMTHFVRIQAINASDKLAPSPYSKVIKIKVKERINSPQITNDNAVFMSNTPNFIQWDLIKGIEYYLIEFSSDENFEKKLKKIIRGSQAEIPFKHSGIFYTRVASLLDGNSNGPYSKTFTFSIRKILPAPEIIYFKEVDPPFIIWKKMKEAKVYQLEFFNKKSGKSFVKQISGNNYKLEKFQKGEYSWQMSALSNDNVYGLKSEKRDFVIKNPSIMSLCQNKVSAESLNNFSLDKIFIDERTGCILIKKDNN